MPYVMWPALENKTAFCQAVDYFGSPIQSTRPIWDAGNAAKNVEVNKPNLTQTVLSFARFTLGSFLSIWMESSSNVFNKQIILFSRRRFDLLRLLF